MAARRPLRRRRAALLPNTHRPGAPRPGKGRTLSLSWQSAPPLDGAGLARELGARSRRAGVLVLGAQALKLGLQLAGLMLLARLLAPAHFGQMAMVTAVTSLLGLVADLGLAQVIMQRAQLTAAQLSTLFWLNLAFGTALVIATWFLAPVIAWLYADAQLAAIARAGAPVFLLGGAVALYRALLMRQLRFRRVLSIDLVSLALGLVAALALALAGAGVWSLVAMPLVQTTVALLALGRLAGWRPGWPVRGSGVRALLQFGGQLLGVRLLWQLARQVDKLGIGILYGAELLGYYSRGYQLFMLPVAQVVTPLHDVMLPTLSRLGLAPARFARAFGLVLALLTGLCALLVIPALLWPGQLIVLAFGPGWEAVVPVLRNLAPALALQPLLAATGWVLVARGEQQRYWHWGRRCALLQLLAIGLALPFGIDAVARAITLVSWGLVLPLTLRCLHHLSPALARAAVVAVSLPCVLTGALLGAVLRAGGAV